MTADDLIRTYERLAAQAIARVEMRAAEDRELARLADATCDPVEDDALDDADSDDSPRAADYAGAVVFAVLVLAAWCWVAVIS